MSKIQQFYTGQNIFITGGTGFMGKVLTEKLLRSCEDVGTIFLLIRGKKGKSVQERIDMLLADSIFTLLRKEYPDFGKKIVGISGDIADEGLGLSSTDHERLTNEVTMIFHLAATVRFDEPLDRAVAVNVNSTRYIVDIAKACKNLKVAIYVSTAYSHCPRKSINEEFYPPPLTHEQVVQLLEDTAKNKLSEAEMKNFTEQVIGEWPNTYSFSKAIAEGVVAESAQELPFAVFRPSIVTSAYREPLPGWLAGPFGFPASILGAGLGILHIDIASDEIVFDIVPVDYACNALISCGWEVATSERRREQKIPVYNYVSRPQNPIILGELGVKCRLMGYCYPTIHAIYHPSVINTSSRSLFLVLEFFLHLLPALMIDSIARLSGRQPIFYKRARKIGDALRAVSYFTTREWDFKNQRVQDLWQRMRHTDRQIFPFNMEDVDWDEFFMKMVRGLWTYILHESDDSLPQARRRNLYLYIIHAIVKLGFGLFVLWMVWKIFDACGLTTVAKATAV